MLFRLKDKLIEGRNGKLLSAYQPLVARGSVPSSGWGTMVTVRGTKMHCPGRTPDEVRDSLSSLLKGNKIKHDTNALWTTLNMEWLSRTDERLHLVPMKLFLSMVISPTPEEFRGRINVESWLLPALDTIGYYLSIDKESYQHKAVLDLSFVIKDMTTPAKAHRLADHDAYATMLERWDDLRYKPRHLLEDAKTWFVDTYNALTSPLGTTPLTTETATTKYRWDNGPKN